MVYKNLFTVTSLSIKQLKPKPSRILTNTNIRTMSSGQSEVLFDEIKNKGVITLNRPKALNALNLSMVEKIYPVLKKWESEKSFVLIKGTGEKAFCAGGDVRAVVEAGLRGDTLGHDFFKKEYTTNGLIGNYKIPYVALIDGIVMGGGVGLSVHGRYRIATERTLFAMPETIIGLFPDVGASYTLPRLEGSLGVYLALTGHRLKGADVVLAGIGTHYIKSEKMKQLESSLIDDCDNDDDIKNTLTKLCDRIDTQFSLSPHMDKINKHFSARSMEEIFKSLESDSSAFAQETLDTLKKMSPTSLKVSLRELEYGKSMSLNECLRMEYRIAVNCLSNKDFYEGVRALLIDKDKKPKWNPDSLSEVTSQYVDSYFSKLPDDQELKHKL